ncbi:sulfatase-like hydrolase/transferase [Carboxylicivirga mesophila]|uniref:Sulfatase-like hydrolase/transferase n=1 Tax=Carboxylicivirga mesophila TaxID=1166478 RepID=A0ABS5KEA2_9BACT|nr:sulfatase-like hydrolase/transferase [Carboxylicivirga mesophila]MBS2213122.1 sulfatase-like hydrolase/transferase [Carboxylicivirga mesophila]
MKRLLIFCTTLFLTLLSNAQQPNIVFILADDLGYGDLSCYGATDLYTPNIDKLCENGIKFTRAYANSTVCSPSRAAILTGNYPDMVGVPGVIRDMPDNTWGNLSDEVPFLPEQLIALGYHTALVGKWHLGYESPDLPNDRGFDHFKGYVGDMMDDYYTHKRAGINWMREGSKRIEPKGHATDVFTNWAREYINIQSNADNPYFLFLTYNAPHEPIQPPADWLEKIKKREPQANITRQKLIALIEHLDAGVGKVMEAIEKSGEADNTLIVFTSDNGGALQYGANNGLLKGGKGDLYEGGIRIPCVVNWPDKIKPNTVSEPIILMDFYPSLIELAGGNHQQELPSKSLVNLLKEEPPNSVGRELVFMRREGHRFGGRAYYAISNGEYKLMQNSPFESYQLIHISDTSSVEIPVENAAVKEELRKKLMKHIQNSGNIPWR